MPATTDISTLTALDCFEQIQSGKQTAVSVLDATFAQIEKTEPAIEAFNLLTKDLAYEAAQAVDKKVTAGEALPLLAGVPIAIKDNINITNTPTTCSSHILQGYISPYDATVVQKLKTHMLPMVGKTNLDEFAMGSSTENSALKMTKNPWDTSRVPGGSSGGSAAVVASGMTAISLGSDTGGSVRQPASLCGIVGLKPTYGLVSRYGLVAFGSSLDQISPFGRNVKDTAAILQIITGFDPNDSTSLNAGTPDYLAHLDENKDLKGLRIGIIQELQGDGMEPAVAESFQKAIDTLTGLGATTQTVSIPTIPYGVAAYYIVSAAEASSNLARYDGVRFGNRQTPDGGDLTDMYVNTRAKGFGPEVKRRIMLGTFCLSSGYYDAYYGKAQKARQLLRNEFEHAWKSCDVLICPTSPTTAFKIGEKVDDPVSMYLSDIATIPISMAGIPAISIPCGFDGNKLPIGLQILGPHLSEAKLLEVAHAFEQATGLCNLQPH